MIELEKLTGEKSKWKWHKETILDPQKKCVVRTGQNFSGSLCDSGYPLCLKAKCNIKSGGACKHDKECASNNCFQDTCQCKMASKLKNGVCVLDDQPCNENITCKQKLGNLSYCNVNQSQCECSSPYIIVNQDCVKERLIGNRCLNHSECVHKQCRSRCQCPTGTFFDQTICSEETNF
ncbi:prion-like-(Q/N-rich) domain-bearing protein 25 [Gordionus sp. m RMFG-2023]|uniref:prion-like-(Q/N-rich) domain-bearing protein 25 n=1 Tax=Gordionus sp. m RMFG-2023 TaxID=3053472 RepID=UPI0031FC330A